MGQGFQIRTDLAMESRESFPGDGGEIGGVSLRTWTGTKGNVKITEVKILNNRGAQAMGKAMGTYVTLEAGNLTEKDENYHREVSRELAGQLRDFLKEKKIKRNGCRVLVTGLGNRAVTPDSLGPRTVSNLKITRNVAGGDCPVLISAIAPGVMAQTGMETAEILRGIVGETRPDVILAVDALAARSLKRLGTTIQLTDTGIQPGSGVGNHRHSLTEDSLGVPVFAIGVPTVVGVAAIVQDTVTSLTAVLKSSRTTKQAGEFMESMNPDEQYCLIQELLEPEFGSFYVTPPDIDETIRLLSYTISEALHMVFFHEL
ncbi:MAG TPA: GPR endopeptidase [Candidatus Hungatella pullicola]|nr:GPR endopeptidase [Candidatus Hungatella pullicola]